MKRFASAAGLLFSFLTLSIYVLVSFAQAGQVTRGQPHYRVLPPISQGNLTMFPVVSDASFDTTAFLTLDEGVRSGRVVITEAGQARGLIRPRGVDPGIWQERPFPIPQSSARVNELALTNNSERPLILLAGEIVTGGKQDRVVGKDRIIPAHSGAVALSVFCVEPHRWTETSTQFGAMQFSMAQPSIRSKAMADQNQQEVWNQVNESRMAFAATVPLSEGQVQSTSSYAKALQSSRVSAQIDVIAQPFERSYDDLFHRMRGQGAVGVIVAVNNELIWVDLFASPKLFEQYWPKLVRSYVAESMRPRILLPKIRFAPTQDRAQAYLDDMSAGHETIDSDPGVYRTTELTGSDFEAFILTSLLPHTGFSVHIAKMKQS